MLNKIATDKTIARNIRAQYKGKAQKPMDKFIASENYCKNS